MKSLLVGSVFKNTEPDQIEWLDLQLKFLSATTDDYDHVAVLNCEDPEPFNKFTKVVSFGNGNDVLQSQQHVNGLNSLVRYFKTVVDEYENFLFIDNDAFPIKRNWINILRSRMDNHQKSVAAVLRTENLETRLHASVLFCNPEALDNLDFFFGQTGSDLLRYEEQDVGIGDYQDELRGEVWPLIRTNKINIHPISCGVYFDMFYHHAFGSPSSATKFRAELRDYSTHYSGDMTDFPALHQRLQDNPFVFVRRLAGWCPEQYPGSADQCKGETGA